MHVYCIGFGFCLVVFDYHHQPAYRERKRLFGAGIHSFSHRARTHSRLPHTTHPWVFSSIFAPEDLLIKSHVSLCPSLRYLEQGSLFLFHPTVFGSFHWEHSIVCRDGMIITLTDHYYLLRLFLLAFLKMERTKESWAF